MLPARRAALAILRRTQVAFRQLIAHLQKVTPRGQKPILATPPQTDLYRCAMYLHQKLSEAGVPYYFCGGFACINVGMTARSTADIDIAVPNGAHGYGTLLNILSRPPFIQDKTGTLPRDSYYFFVESSGNFVEVDGVIAGFMQFPTLEQAKVIQAGKTMKLNFLEPTGLLKLKFDAWSKKSRREGPKRNGDITDITSLRDLLISNRARMDLVELKGEFAKGLREWVREFGDLKQWQKLDPKYRG
ncbi:uncharacterized protein B0T15DRAFT_137774 [Chaetomium strumarium]|uniref:Uncharacterized protein n=1 Tax=Chaetomium strumarium TaxID=1170767 RepID=A0AAJ0M287_9PEZI|nr:hypothetical protein B0T15DRAFT_137774 [Chaetomium strumarium]